MFRRIDDVGPRSEHGDRGSAARERTAMRRGIDAAREAAHHDDAPRGEIGRQPFRDGEPVLRRGARTDQGDRGTLERSRRPARPEHKGRIRDGGERRRIRRVAPRHRRDAAVGCATDCRERALVERGAFRRRTRAPVKKLGKNGLRCFAGAKTFRGVTPGPRRQERQADKIGEIGKRGHDAPRANAGPDLLLQLYARGHDRPRFVTVARTKLCETRAILHIYRGIWLAAALSGPC